MRQVYEINGSTGWGFVVECGSSSQQKRGRGKKQNKGVASRNARTGNPSLNCNDGFRKTEAAEAKGAVCGGGNRSVCWTGAKLTIQARGSTARYHPYQKKDKHNAGRRPSQPVDGLVGRQRRGPSQRARSPLRDHWEIEGPEISPLDSERYREERGASYLQRDSFRERERGCSYRERGPAYREGSYREPIYGEGSYRREGSHREDFLRREGSHREDFLRREGSHREDFLRREGSHREDFLRREGSHREHPFRREDCHRDGSYREREGEVSFRAAGSCIERRARSESRESGEYRSSASPEYISRQGAYGDRIFEGPLSYQSSPVLITKDAQNDEKPSQEEGDFVASPKDQSPAASIDGEQNQTIDSYWATEHKYNEYSFRNSGVPDFDLTYHDNDPQECRSTETGKNRDVSDAEREGLHKQTEDLPPGFASSTKITGSPRPPDSEKCYKDAENEVRHCYKCCEVGHLSYRCPKDCTTPVPRELPADSGREERWSKRACYTCGQSGHFSFQCPSKDKVNHGSEMIDKKSNACFKCGALGHFSYRCPQRANDHRDNGAIFTSRLTDAEKEEYIRLNKCFTCGNTGHPYYRCPQSEKRLHAVLAEKEQKSKWKMWKEPSWCFQGRDGYMEGPFSVQVMSSKLDADILGENLQVRHMHLDIEPILLGKLIQLAKSGSLSAVLNGEPAAILEEVVDKRRCTAAVSATIEAKLHSYAVETTGRWLFINVINENLERFITARKSGIKFSNLPKSRPVEDDYKQKDWNNEFDDFSSPPGFPAQCESESFERCSLSQFEGCSPRAEADSAQAPHAVLLECEALVRDRCMGHDVSDSLAAVQKCLHTAVLEAARRNILDVAIGEFFNEKQTQPCDMDPKDDAKSCHLKDTDDEYARTLQKLCLTGNENDSMRVDRIIVSEGDIPLSEEEIPLMLSETSSCDRAVSGDKNSLLKHPKMNVVEKHVVLAASERPAKTYQRKNAEKIAVKQKEEEKKRLSNGVKRAREERAVKNVETANEKAWNVDGENTSKVRKAGDGDRSSQLLIIKLKSQLRCDVNSLEEQSDKRGIDDDVSDDKKKKAMHAEISKADMETETPKRVKMKCPDEDDDVRLNPRSRSLDDIINSVPAKTDMGKYIVELNDSSKKAKRYEEDAVVEAQVAPIKPSKAKAVEVESKVKSLEGKSKSKPVPSKQNVRNAAALPAAKEMKPKLQHNKSKAREAAAAAATATATAAVTAPVAAVTAAVTAVVTAAPSVVPKAQEIAPLTLNIFRKSKKTGGGESMKNVNGGLVVQKRVLKLSEIEKFVERKSGLDLKV